MTFFITNLSEISSVVFKNLEILPGESKRVSEFEIKAGTFDDFINRGLVSLVEADIAPSPIYEKKSVVTSSLDSRDGITEAELRELLAKRKNPANQEDPKVNVTHFG